MVGGRRGVAGGGPEGGEESSDAGEKHVHFGRHHMDDGVLGSFGGGEGCRKTEKMGRKE